MRITIIVAAIIVASCAGTVGGFKDGAAFQAYVDSLHLSDMSIRSAADKLSAEHFNCAASTLPRSPSGSIDCIKGIGSQSLMVQLMPIADSSDRCRVVASRTLVFA